MVRFSPRTYIFEGLQLIREPLIRFIWEIFENSDEYWWRNYIYKYLNENENYRGKAKSSGEYSDMLKLLDAFDCIKIIQKNKTLFSEIIDIHNIKNLYKIRNHYCVHISEEVGIINKETAGDALSEMAILMRKIDAKCYNELSELRKYLHKQEYKEIVASRDELINFLYNNIWKPSIDILDSSQIIDNDLRKQLIDKMWEAYDEISGFETAEKVEQWFRRHLYSNEGVKMYDKLKSIKEVVLPTFEDKRKAFMQLCYGE
jgi:hypothetical protein